MSTRVAKAAQAEARLFFKFAEGTQLYNSVLDTLFTGGL